MNDEETFRTLMAITVDIPRSEAGSLAGPFTWHQAHAFALFLRGQVSLCQALRFLVPYQGREPIIEFSSRPDPTTDVPWNETCDCPACRDRRRGPDPRCDVPA